MLSNTVNQIQWPRGRFMCALWQRQQRLSKGAQSERTDSSADKRAALARQPLVLQVVLRVATGSLWFQLVLVLGSRAELGGEGLLVPALSEPGLGHVRR